MQRCALFKTSSIWLPTHAFFLFPFHWKYIKFTFYTYCNFSGATHVYSEGNTTAATSSTATFSFVLSSAGDFYIAGVSSTDSSCASTSIINTSISAVLLISTTFYFNYFLYYYYSSKAPVSFIGAGISSTSDAIILMLFLLIPLSLLLMLLIIL